MTSPQAVAHALASAFLAGEWTREGLLASADATLDRRPRRLRFAVRQVLRFHPRPPADRPRELAAFIAVALHPVRRPLPRVLRIPPFEAAMGRMRWPVPELPTPGDLAAWLSLDAANWRGSPTPTGWSAESPTSACATTATRGSSGARAGRPD